jgi:hypothetical protein
VGVNGPPGPLTSPAVGTVRDNESAEALVGLAVDKARKDKASASSGSLGVSSAGPKMFVRRFIDMALSRKMDVLLKVLVLVFKSSEAQ